MPNINFYQNYDIVLKGCENQRKRNESSDTLCVNKQTHKKGKYGNLCHLGWSWWDLQNSAPRNSNIYKCRPLHLSLSLVQLNIIRKYVRSCYLHNDVKWWLSWFSSLYYTLSFLSHWIFFYFFVYIGVVIFIVTEIYIYFILTEKCGLSKMGTVFFFVGIEINVRNVNVLYNVRFSWLLGVVSRV